MNGRGLAWARIAVLVALVGFFAGSLIYGMVRQATDMAIQAQPSERGVGQDPGIRVRLTNRRALLGDDDVRADNSGTFAELSVRLLAPAVLWSPEERGAAPPERIKKLRAGTRLRLIAGADGSMIINSPDIHQGEWHWSVKTLRIQPAEGEVSAPWQYDVRRESSERSAWLGIGQRRFRGCLDVRWLDQRQIQAINVLPIEAYIEGVVDAEMGSSYPLEALKAQAIAARGIALMGCMRARAAGADFDVTDNSDDQQYIGQGSGAELVRRSVIETRGVLMTSGGRVFESLYHASSGGFTAPMTSFSTQDPSLMAYRQQLSRSVLAGKEDRYCRPGAEARLALNTHWRSQAIIRPRALQEALNRFYAPQGRVFGLIRSIEVGRRDALRNRVESVIVQHGNDRSEIPGDVFRAAVGPQALRSLLWPKDPERVVLPSNEVQYLITTQGWGHGIGMSQVSAYAMASDGRSATQILSAFYSGMRLEMFW